MIRETASCPVESSRLSEVMSDGCWWEGRGLDVKLVLHPQRWYLEAARQWLIAKVARNRRLVHPHADFDVLHPRQRKVNRLECLRPET